MQGFLFVFVYLLEAEKKNKEPGKKKSQTANSCKLHMICAHGQGIRHERRTSKFFNAEENFIWITYFQ